MLLQSDAETTAQRRPGELSFTSFMDLLCRELKKLENALYGELFGDCGMTVPAVATVLTSAIDGHCRALILSERRRTRAGVRRVEE